MSLVNKPAISNPTFTTVTVTRSHALTSTVNDDNTLFIINHNVGDKVRYLNKKNIDVSTTITEVTRDLNRSHVYFITSEDIIGTHTSSNNINFNWKVSDGFRLQSTSNFIKEHPPTREMYKYKAGDKVCYKYGKD